MANFEPAKDESSEATQFNSRPSPELRQSHGRELSIVLAFVALATMIGCTLWVRSVLGADGERIAKLEQIILQHQSKLALHDSALEEDKKSIEDALLKAGFASLQASSPLIDLSESTSQNAGQGFNVGKLDVQDHGAGIQVSGQVVNTQSISHGMVQFKLTIFDARFKEVATGSASIQMLAAGASAYFSSTIPGVDAKTARSMRFEYESSTMYFRN